MDEALKAEMAKYVAQRYAADSDTIVRESQADMQKQKNEFARRGLIQSGAAVMASVQNQANLIKSLVIARANAVMEVHELYGVPIDENLIQEARDTVSVQVPNAAKSLAASPLNSIMYSNDSKQREQYFEQQLQSLTSGFLNELSCEVERRKIKQMRPSEAKSVTYVFQHGPASKVNIDSTDQSVTTVNIANQQELFSQLRDVIGKATNDSNQEEILTRLSHLEKADKHNVWDRFKDFVTVASGVMSIVGPYVPALTEWAHKIAN